MVLRRSIELQGAGGSSGQRHGHPPYAISEVAPDIALDLRA